MKKIFVFIVSLLLICCKKENRVVEYDTENILEANNKEISIPQFFQRNIPKEEIIFNDKLDILNRINENIVESNFENAKAIIGNIVYDYRDKYLFRERLVTTTNGKKFPKNKIWYIFKNKYGNSHQAGLSGMEINMYIWRYMPFAKKII
jgi:hypothetical protein